MTIETKFNIGDKVSFWSSVNRPMSGIVKYINIGNIFENNVFYVTYILEGGDFHEEKDLFRNKEELFEHRRGEPIPIDPVAPLYYYENLNL